MVGSKACSGFGTIEADTTAGANVVGATWNLCTGEISPAGAVLNVKR